MVPQDVSGPRGTDQGSVGRARTLQSELGPVEQIGTMRDEPGPRRSRHTNQDPKGRIRVRRTNLGPVARALAPDRDNGGTRGLSRELTQDLCPTMAGLATTSRT